MGETVREVDYTGCSALDLLELMRMYSLDSLDMKSREAFCDMAGIKVRDFNRVIYGEVEFVGLNTADKICLGMGLEITDYLDVIPSGYKNSAKRMAEDEFWARGIEPSPSELDERVLELKALRESVLNKIKQCNLCKAFTKDFSQKRVQGQLSFICHACILETVTLTA